MESQMKENPSIIPRIQKLKSKDIHIHCEIEKEAGNGTQNTGNENTPVEIPGQHAHILIHNIYITTRHDQQRHQT